MDKEQRAKLLTEIMEEDQKNGLYDIPGVEKKMTAIDWFYQQTVIEGKTNYWELLEQAKQMEKEQSKQDYDAGLFDGTMDDVKDRLYKNAEQYYNETYNK